MLRIGSETCFAGLELSAEKRHWKLVALATGIYHIVYRVAFTQAARLAYMDLLFFF